MPYWKTSLAFLLCAVMECPTAPGQGLGIDQLPSPLFGWEHGNALCSQVRVVDAEGMLWHNEGCEDGAFRFDAIGVVGDAEAEALRAAFGRFPQAPPRPACSGGMVHQFVQRSADGTETRWLACGESSVQGGLEGLETPFLDAARILSGGSRT